MVALKKLKKNAGLHMTYVIYRTVRLCHVLLLSHKDLHLQDMIILNEAC